jgi:carbon monoxide dehydrogenase subunit G
LHEKPVTPATTSAMAKILTWRGPCKGLATAMLSLWPAPRRHNDAAARILALALGIAAFGACLSTLAAPPAAWWQRNPSDPRWVQGQVDLATPAPAVWQRMSNVSEWPSIFSDILSFSVQSESSDGTHWVIRFESRLVRHGRFDYLVTLNAAGKSSRIVVNAPGIRAGVYASVAPIDAAHSRVRFSAFVDKVGVIGWFLSERFLRERQEQLVEQDGADLKKAFGSTGGSH